jgi:emp24/gp25L/p24 family/GOLD
VAPQLTYTSVAPLLYISFRSANTSLMQAINSEMDLMISREAALKVSSVDMEWRINAAAVFSIAVLLGLSAWQMVFLKKFFRSKKLL